MDTCGTLFLMVGNSGSGKDTLIREAQHSWPSDGPEMRVPRRFVTRPPHPSEPFESVSTEQFSRMEANRRFCLSWKSYGLYYGVPSEMEQWLKDGIHAMVNISRQVIPIARNRFQRVRVVFVQVPLEVTLSRIRDRGREQENDPDYQKRLGRAKENPMLADADFVLDNSGPIASGVRQLTDYMLNCIK